MKIITTQRPIYKQGNQYKLQFPVSIIRGLDWNFTKKEIKDEKGNVRVSVQKMLDAYPIPNHNAIILSDPLARPCSVLAPIIQQLNQPILEENLFLDDDQKVAFEEFDRLFKIIASKKGIPSGMEDDEQTKELTDKYIETQLEIDEIIKQSENKLNSLRATREDILHQITMKTLERYNPKTFKVVADFAGDTS